MIGIFKTGLSLFYFLYCFNDLWHHFKSVTNNSIVGSLKERGLGIRVNNNYAFAAVYPGKVLYSARNTNGNV